MKNNLDASWLNGKYTDINSEINTKLPYLSIGDEFYVQGDDADVFISEILAIWNNNDITVESSILRFAEIYDINI